MLLRNMFRLDVAINTRYVTAFLSVLALSLYIISQPVHDTRAAERTVFITSTAIVDHPALSATRDGVLDVLKQAGYVQGKNLRFVYESAQGNMSTAIQIARKFIGEKPDVIVPISTASTQAIVSATKTIPIVFSTVTDPVGAKIVSNMKRPGGNVTGVVDFPPLADHIALIREISPKAKRIGVIYNPGEANSITQIKLLRPIMEKAGLVMIEGSVSKTADVIAAARSLVGKVDVIYVPNDNTAVAAIETVVKVGIDNKIPVYAGDTDSVKRGAIATFSFNYRDIGRQAGRIVLRVLNGEKPGDIPVEQAKELALYVNPGSAEKMGITIPKAVIARAKTVVE